MRIKILRPGVKAYFNYEVRTFAVGDEVDGELAELIAGNHPDGTVEVLDGAPNASKDEKKTEPPAGGGDVLDVNAKADVVLAWVGDDPARAAQALAAESAKDKPRSTLVKALEKVTETDTPDGPGDGDEDDED